MTRTSASLCLLAALVVAVPASSVMANKPVEPAGLGDPGVLDSLRVDVATAEGAIVIRGRDARQQLVITGVFSSGQLRDRTTAAKYSASPDGIVNIADDGLITPVADGEADVKATVDGRDVTVKVRVEGVSQQIPINFKNQVTPVFTKLGCNSGGCHGKASGQNGFKLSLLGFYPDEDHEYW